MKPLFQSYLVNGLCGDPVLYVDFLFERRALLFDVGNIRSLPPRKLLRVSDVFVSHTHMDHFADFDWLLRLALGRDKRIRMYGPQGFIDRIQHKLGAYTWNLVKNYDKDLSLEVIELHSEGIGRRANFKCRHGFSREDDGPLELRGNVLLEDSGLQVRGAVLDHSIPCLGFTLEEKLHINVWKNRLDELGLPVGPWLRELKRAVLTQQPDNTLIRIWWKENGKLQESSASLGDMKEKVLRIVPGQKISYIVDIIYHRENRGRVVELIRGSDMLYIEATFLHEDLEMAAQKNHLTAHQAAALAQAAGVRRVVPCHLSPRYAHRQQDLLEEVHKTFRSRT